MSRLLVGICALALALPGAVAVRAQSPEGGEHRAGPPRMREPLHRFSLVLDHSADLSLTSDQVNQLEMERGALTERNKPLEDEARSIMSNTRGAEEGADAVTREVAMANFERVRKVREQVEKNDKEAWKDGEKVLTKDQKKKADKLISAREDELKGDRPAFRGSRNGPMSGRHRPGGPQ